jgi:hypothetical protein
MFQQDNHIGAGASLVAPPMSTPPEKKNTRAELLKQFQVNAFVVEESSYRLDQRKADEAEASMVMMDSAIKQPSQVVYT